MSAFMSTMPTVPAVPAAPQKKASTACRACQSRKSKCTGGVPCETCLARDTDCIIDETTDGRRKTALKRKQYELHKVLLDQIIKVLRDGDDKHLRQLIDVVRDNASLENIKSSIENSMLETPWSPALHESHAEPSRSIGQGQRFDDSRCRLGVHRLLDRPLFDLPAAPWTSVTNDNQLVSHLISLWFTWSGPSQSWIDRDLFIRDMQSGQLGARYCSPFLVNIMLAHACPYSDFPELKTTESGTSEMMDAFLREAKHLFDQEAGRASLTTMQGLGILYQCVSSMGEDRQGWIYVRALANMSRELYPMICSQNGSSEEGETIMLGVFERAWWGLWMATTMSCLIWSLPPIMEPPMCPRPNSRSHDTVKDDWAPYPGNLLAVQGHTDCVFQAHIDLTTIVFDITHALCSTKTVPDFSEMEGVITNLHARLDTWYKEIPVCLARSSHMPCHLVFLHLCYHHLIIVLYSHLPTTLARDCGLRGKLAAPRIDRFRDQRTRAAIQIAELLRAHEAVYGISRMGDNDMHSMAAALFTLLDEDLGVDEVKSSFIGLCDFARAVSRRWILGKGVFRMIQLTARNKQRRTAYPVLPSETEELFGEFERRSWTVGDSMETTVELHREFRSSYPNLIEFIEDKKNAYDRRLRERLTPGEPWWHEEADLFDGGSPVVGLDAFLHKYDNSLVAPIEFVDTAAAFPHQQAKR